MNIKRFISRRGVIHLCSFILPFLMVQVFYAISGVFPYNDCTILTGDMDLEFVNFYGYFINTFKSKSDWLYMPAKTLGGDFASLAAFQLHDPLLLLLFFFPGEKLAMGVEFVFSMQVSLAGLSMSYLLNKRFGESFASLLFSTAYAFSGFFFGYLVLTIYFGCLALLPLLIYHFLKYLDDKRYFVPYVLLTALYIYINFHMGFMLVIFLCIFFVSRIIADKTYTGRIPAFIVSGITILMIDGYFLIRTGLSLLGAKTTEGADYGFYRRFNMNQLFAGFLSGCTRSETMPLIYCSVAVVFFALLYLISGKFSLREKLADLFVIATIAISMWINTLDAVWHGFNNPEGFYFRYAFFISFVVIVMGYKGSRQTLTDETEGDRVKHARVLMAGCIMGLYIVWLKISNNRYLDLERLIFNTIIVALILIAVLTAIMYDKAYCYALGCLIIISAVDMIYNARVSYVALNSDDGEAPRMSVFRQDYRDINDVISYIRENGEGLYRIEKDFDRAVNDPALFNYMGMSHDSSCEKDKIIDWLRNFGFPRTVYYTYYNNGGTSFVDSFFGIEYFVSRFDTIEKPYEKMPYQGMYYAYHNEGALPIAYIAPGDLDKFDFDGEDTFVKQNRIAAFWGLDDEIYKEAGYTTRLEGAEEIEPGHYRRTDGRGFVVYNLNVTEDMPVYLYFAAPNKQGAGLFVNDVDMGRYFSETHWNVICAGKFKPGDELEIKLEILDDEIEVERPCFYYEDPGALKEWAHKAAKLNGAIGKVEEIKSSHLKFETSSDKAEKVMMSIPYDSAWKVLCDGKSIRTDEAMQALLSFDVPGGDHTIDMRYIPHGTIPGLLVSGVGVILFIILSLLIFYPASKEKDVTFS